MDTRLPVYADANPPPDDDDDPPPPIAARLITIPGDDAEAIFIKLLRDLGARLVDVTPGPDTPDGEDQDEEEETVCLDCGWRGSDEDYPFHACSGG